MTRLDAIQILEGIRAKVNQDFYTLTNEQVCNLLAYADSFKYRKPKNANGSRGRYFYAFVSRRARRAI